MVMFAPHRFYNLHSERISHYSTESYTGRFGFEVQTLTLLCANQIEKVPLSYTLLLRKSTPFTYQIKLKTMHPYSKGKMLMNSITVGFVFEWIKFLRAFLCLHICFGGKELFWRS